MKKLSLFIFFLFSVSSQIFSQKITDSLILFSDLKYHSDFEKEALLNFVKHNKDTFNLFSAIDENMSKEAATFNYKTYLKIFEELNQNNIQTKNLRKKIKISYSTVHNRFLKKYNENELYSAIFQTGTYNCVTASILYAMVFNKLDIPYKVMASSNHVYLVASPGSNSVVVETTNPNFQMAIFTGEFKQQYVNYLRTSKLISEVEYKNKSVEEIFEAKFNEVKEAEFINLLGFQYYNKALSKLQNQDITEALKLIQKAYFFYPDQQVKSLLFTTLIFQLEKCSFDKITDVDYLAQFSRFENIELNTVTGIFENVISHYLQFINKESYCDSLYQRLIPQISNKRLKDEICFSYNMQMSYRYQRKDKVEKYITKALEIKNDYLPANMIMITYIIQKLDRISSPYALSDTIDHFKKKYNFTGITAILDEYKLISILKTATTLYDENKIVEGAKYIQEFENKCKFPIDVDNDHSLKYWTEGTYDSIARYYYKHGDNLKAKKYIETGLKYVPDSQLLKTSKY